MLTPCLILTSNLFQSEGKKITFPSTWMLFVNFCVRMQFFVFLKFPFSYFIHCGVEHFICQQSRFTLSCYRCESTWSMIISSWRDRRCHWPETTTKRKNKIKTTWTLHFSDQLLRNKFLPTRRWREEVSRVSLKIEAPSVTSGSYCSVLHNTDRAKEKKNIPSSIISYSPSFDTLGLSTRMRV